ncbi:MAG TPA: S8 family serine peptidase, partial [bacterium]|nr:S8 family serine peptidase [bacterium]
SQAAAHISGICGLIISANPHLTAQEVKNLLYSTASDLGATGRDNYYGYGLADAYRAVSTACGSVVYSPANTILSANTIDMYLPEDSVVINIYNTGVDTLIVTGTSVSDLRCTADIINSNNTYKIRFRIDANSFSNANDSYLIQSLIYSNAGTDTVLIYVHTSQTLKILTDEVFVLILDPDDNFKTVRETSTNYFKNFEYSLSNIPAGRYYLAAGTDKNNNNSLGDIAGEYIGFYPLFTDRKKIVVEPNIKLSGLNFEIFKTASGF